MRFSWARKLGRATWLAAALTASGCGAEEAADAPGEPGAPSEEEAQADTTTPRVLSSDVARLTRESGALRFPHGPHSGIVCAQCHTSLPGHDTHAAVACAECHKGSAFLGERVVFSQGECMSCHHDSNQAYGCARCHETGPAPVTRTESVHLAVWPTPRTRALPFDHERHATVDCRTCHAGGVTLQFSQTCESCHEEHHQPELNCSTCHSGATDASGAAAAVAAPGAVQEAHQVEAHLGCAGAACHSDPLPAALALAPATCLVCHTAQVDHEPGGSCATCHQVRALGEPFEGAEEAWR